MLRERLGKAPTHISAKLLTLYALGANQHMIAVARHELAEEIKEEDNTPEDNHHKRDDNDSDDDDDSDDDLPRRDFGRQQPPAKQSGKQPRDPQPWDNPPPRAPQDTYQEIYNYRSGKIRVKYIVEDGDLKLPTGMPLATAEEQAAIIAAKHMRARYLEHDRDVPTN